MRLVIILFCIYGFLESSSYAIYEYKQNKAGAICTIILSTLRACVTHICYIYLTLYYNKRRRKYFYVSLYNKLKFKSFR